MGRSRAPGSARGSGLGVEARLQSLEAEAHGADLIELECRLPADEAKRRVLARRRDEPTASDARPEVVDYLRARRDPWPSAVGVDTSETVSDAADTTIATVWHHCTVHVRRG